MVEKIVEKIMEVMLIGLIIGLIYVGLDDLFYLLF